MLGDVQVFPQTPMRINSYFEESMGLYVMSRVDFCKKMTEKTGIPQQSLAKNSSGPLRLELQQHWPGRSFPVGNWHHFGPCQIGPRRFVDEWM